MTLTIASNEKKYLEINVIKEVKDLKIRTIKTIKIEARY